MRGGKGKKRKRDWGEKGGGKQYSPVTSGNQKVNDVEKRNYREKGEEGEEDGSSLLQKKMKWQFPSADNKPS